MDDARIDWPARSAGLDALERAGRWVRTEGGWQDVEARLDAVEAALDADDPVAFRHEVLQLRQLATERVERMRRRVEETQVPASSRVLLRIAKLVDRLEDPAGLENAVAQDHGAVAPPAAVDATGKHSER